MPYFQLLNCFINAVAYAYHAAHGRPLVDEDLSMAFDAADVAARGNPGASIQQMHDLGDAYFARVYHD